MTVKYVAQRYGTWEWLHTDLPIEIDDGPEWVNSSYGALDFAVAPDLGMQEAFDGRRLFERWGTLIHAEAGAGADRRRWTGVVKDSYLEGKEWRVAVVEFPGYLEDMPLETLIRAVKDDPADVFRRIWQDIQSYRNGWLGVTVHGVTPVRIGSDSDDRVAAARATMDTRKRTLDLLTKTKSSQTTSLQVAASTLADEVAAARAQVTSAQQYVNQLISDNATPAQIDAAIATVSARQVTLSDVLAAYQTETNAGKAAVSTAKKSVESARAAHKSAQEAYRAAQDRAKADGGAYEIRGEDLPDAKKAISDLCKLTGMEWTTRTRFSEGAPELEIHVHYPLAGRVRNDLVFEKGINIISEIELTEDGDDYANAGIGVGAGEGRFAVRRTVVGETRRLRRPAVIEDRSIKSNAVMDTALRFEIRRRSADFFVEEITVIDHELAPIFSWQVGDFITVKAKDVPHYGNFNKLHRIVSWRLKGDDKAVLRLRPATDY